MFISNDRRSQAVVSVFTVLKSDSAWASLSYIIAVGIYRLFVAKEDGVVLDRIKIEKFVDLKKKIISVVVVALGVAFLGLVAEAAPWRTILGTGAGIALVVASLGFFYG